MLTESSSRIEFHPPMEDDPVRRRPDIALARRLLGWEPTVSREEGLRLVNEENRPRYPTIRWYTEAVNVDYEHAIRVINAVPKLYA